MRIRLPKFYLFCPVYFGIILLAIINDGEAPTGAPIQGPKGIHPKLFLTADKEAALKQAIETTHKFLWKRYLQDLPHMVEVSKCILPLEDNRMDGDLATDLAFAWIVTGNESLLNIARTHPLRLSEGESRGIKTDLIYLVPGHFLPGIALGYNWLYPVSIQTALGEVKGRIVRLKAIMNWTCEGEKVGITWDFKNKTVGFN